MIYPFPCCRCGFCCLSETCPVGQRHYGVNKQTPCPGLSFDNENLSTCALALTNPAVMGVGAGCCIKARAIKGGRTYEFAALPAHIKRALAQHKREGKL